MDVLRFFRVCAALGCLAFGTVALPQTRLAQARLSFDIPAQPASSAIRALAQQSGLQVAALTDDLTGIRTNAVHGVYAPMDALKLLIKDTGLSLDVTEANSVTIHRIDSESVPPRT